MRLSEIQTNLNSFRNLGLGFVSTGSSLKFHFNEFPRDLQDLDFSLATAHFLEVLTTEGPWIHMSCPIIDVFVNLILLNFPGDARTC